MRDIEPVLPSQPSWLQRSTSPRGLILVYHRVSSTDVHNDPYAVSLENFAEHVSVFSQYRAVSISDMCKLKTDGSHRGSIAITFDDGYSDLFGAIELLQKHQLPSTCYLIADSYDSPYQLLSADQIKLLAKDTLIEIGSHSLSHQHLSELAVDAQAEQIAASKAKLSQLIEAEVKTFAYPYGSATDFTRETVNLVERAGYTSACTAIPDVVWQGTNNFLLPRIVMRNVPGDYLRSWMSTWLGES